MKIHVAYQDENGNITESDIQLDLTPEEEEFFKESEKLYCKCDYLEKHPRANEKYVENYKGVNNGYICPGCKKFIQIG